MSVDAVIGGIEPKNRYLYPSPSDYDAIRKSSVSPPALGQIKGVDYELNLYQVEYEHLKGSPVIELWLPAPHEKAPDFNWSHLFLAKIDRWESEHSSSRWGSLKREIAALVLNQENRHLVFGGSGLSLIHISEPTRPY